MRKSHSDLAAMLDRRRFLQAAGMLGASGVAMNLQLASSALATVTPTQTEFRAAVCLFLFGGIDSFNVLTPFDEPEYSTYVQSRGAVALPKSSTNPYADIVEPITDTHQGGRRFGVHSKAKKLRELYNAGKLAFIANAGSLVEPMSVAEYHAQSKVRPVGVRSHNDMQRSWQSGMAHTRNPQTGWAGRAAELLSDATNSHPLIPMNYTLAGTNLLLNGDSLTPYAATENGAVTFNDYRSNNNGRRRAIRQATDATLDANYPNLFTQSIASIRRNAIDSSLAFIDATSSVSISTEFPNTPTGNRLKQVAKTIAIAGTLGQQRQIFMVGGGSGWDSHLQAMPTGSLTEVCDATKAFYDATVELGVENQVTLFACSDFGRTLSSNTNKGTDHGWGGNYFAVGGAVKGSRVYGTYPDLTLGGPGDITSRGIPLPTTASDVYLAEIAAWLGIPNDQYLELVFPNLRNFVSAGATLPLQFLL
jgi:uncharacterized protein (DUF1501 family)